MRGEPEDEDSPSEVCDGGLSNNKEQGGARSQPKTMWTNRFGQQTEDGFQEM